MKFCSIETSFESITFAFAEDGRVISEYTFHNFTQPFNHLFLLQQLQRLLVTIGWTLEDLDFIGLVQDCRPFFSNEQNNQNIKEGIAQQLQIPSVSVFNIDVIAWTTEELRRDLTVIFPVSQKQWLAASYAWDEKAQMPKYLSAPQIYQPDNFLRQLALYQKLPIIAVESGNQEYNSNIRRNIRATLSVDASFLPATYKCSKGYYITKAIWHQWQKLGPSERPFALYHLQSHIKPKPSQTEDFFCPHLNNNYQIITDGIQPMREEDIKDIMKIELRSFASPWSPLAFVTELRYNDDALYFSLFNQGKIIGYTGLLLIEDKGYLAKIAVDPDSRRKGWGKRLIQFIIKESLLRNVRELNLELRKSNHSAWHFYRKIGFKQIGVWHNYYDNPLEDAIVMVLDLQELQKK